MTSNPVQYALWRMPASTCTYLSVAPLTRRVGGGVTSEYFIGVKRLNATPRAMTSPGRPGKAR